MKRPSTPASPPIDGDKTGPKLEDVVNSAAWAERLEQTKTWREEALSQTGKNVVPKPPAKTGTATKPQSPDQTGTTYSDADLGDDVPSIEEVLSGGSWEDRLAKARIRRETIIAKREPASESAQTPTGANRIAEYKDTIGVALAGTTRVPQKVHPIAEDEAPTITSSPPRKLTQGRIAAGVVVLIGLGLTLGAKIADDRTILANPSPSGGQSAVTIPPTGKIKTITLKAPIVGPSQGALDSIAINENAVDIEQNVISAVPSQTVIPAARETGVASVSAPQVEQAHATPAPPLKTTLPDFDGALVMTLGPANFPDAAHTPNQIGSVLTTTDGPISAGSRGSAKFIRPGSMQLASLKTEQPLRLGARPEHDPRNYGQNRDSSNRPLAMYGLSTSLQNPSSTESGGLRPNILGGTNKPTTPISVIILGQPTVPDKALSAPPPTAALQVAASSPVFPPFHNTTDVTETVNRLEILPVPTPLLNFGSATTILVSPAPPVSISIPNPVAPAYKYSIRLNAPSSLSNRRLTDFTKALRDTGHTVRDANRVSFRVSTNHVRYFHPDDREAAGQLAAAIGGKLRDFTDYSPAPVLGTIEVWLAGPNTPARAVRRAKPAQPTENPALSSLRNRLLQSLRRGDHL
ncbi:MAG: hypothetical protein KUG69_10595 [Marinosulfonomonas sp.]|nr:hypothetical protein [Marinosulfonomonas sp.]